MAESKGETPIGTLKWYINWSQQKCVQDCDDPTYAPNCGGLAAAWVTLFATEGECCEDSYTDDYRGNCLVPTSSPSDAPSSSPSAAPSESPSSKPSESSSGESPSSKPSASPSSVPTWIGEFIVDQPNDKCVQKPAGDNWSATYPTIQQCCRLGLPWTREEVCASNSNSGGPAFSGTNEWYMDWVAWACVKDCDSGTDCGGLANKWDVLFPTVETCCDAAFTGTWGGNCPTPSPSPVPSASPSEEPSSSPSASPSYKPSSIPFASPSYKPSSSPSTAPSNAPSGSPSTNPSSSPSEKPSLSPSAAPSTTPSGSPSTNPSSSPSEKPSLSASPSDEPSASPSASPSYVPSVSPTQCPRYDPTPGRTGIGSVRSTSTAFSTATCTRDAYTYSKSFTSAEWPGSTTVSVAGLGWADWGGDIFDGWGAFYLWDGAATLPTAIAPLEGAGAWATEMNAAAENGYYTFETCHNGNTFETTYAWRDSGTIMFQVICKSDPNLDFYVGGGGNMGSDSSTYTYLRSEFASISGVGSRTIQYIENHDGGSYERFYIHGFPVNDVGPTWALNYYRNYDNIYFWTGA